MIRYSLDYYSLYFLLQQPMPSHCLRFEHRPEKHRREGWREPLLNRHKYESHHPGIHHDYRLRHPHQCPESRRDLEEKHHQNLQHHHCHRLRQLPELDQTMSQQQTCHHSSHQVCRRYRYRPRRLGRLGRRRYCLEHHRHRYQDYSTRP